ncbi:MAG: hypothetical protein HFJ87_01665 [Muribaculaceae bacterium]|nr:hypothetical protein [Muribaculaceae bacterium]
MQKNLVHIPYANRDHVIGSVLNATFSVIGQTNLTDGATIWDYSKAQFLHPFFIAPLGIYRDSCGNVIEEANVPNAIRGYLDATRVNSPICLDEGSDIEAILAPYKYKTYTPLCKFSIGYSRIDPMQTAMQNVIRTQIERRVRLDIKMQTAISYLLGELVCNIQEHSKASFGYLYTQYLPSENTLYVAIGDNGLTIYGSYLHSKREDYLEAIGQSEAAAIRLSTEGKSTKPYAPELRGYGISTNSEMIAKGLGGAFFILSGGAFHRRDAKSSDFANLPPSIHWDGTLILVKIPLNQRPDFDVYKYIVH